MRRFFLAYLCGEKGHNPLDEGIFGTGTNAPIWVHYVMVVNMSELNQSLYPWGKSESSPPGCPGLG